MRVIDLSTLSLVGGSGIAEVKVPLWWSDGASASTTSGSMVYLQDGTTSLATSSSSSSVKLFTLSSTFPKNINFSLEVTGYTSDSTRYCMIELYDFTSSSAEMLITITATAPTVTRSSQQSLVPSHTYGIIMESNGSTGSSTAYISDASLIIFPQ